MILLFALIIASCTSENKTSESADSTEMTMEDTTRTATVPVANKIVECYQFVKNRDTVNMRLNREAEELTGELDYKWFEKDKNTGTFAGEMKGDTIIAEYLFDSEGMRSVRDVVFLKKDDKIYEGFGKTTERGGKITFVNRAELKFGDAVVLVKIPCD